MAKKLLSSAIRRTFKEKLSIRVTQNDIKTLRKFLPRGCTHGELQRLPVDDVKEIWAAVEDQRTTQDTSRRIPNTNIRPTASQDSYANISAKELKALHQSLAPDCSYPEFRDQVNNLLEDASDLDDIWIALQDIRVKALLSNESISAEELAEVESFQGLPSNPSRTSPLQPTTPALLDSVQTFARAHPFYKNANAHQIDSQIDKYAEEVYEFALHHGLSRDDSRQCAREAQDEYMVIKRWVVSQQGRAGQKRKRDHTATLTQQQPYATITRPKELAIQPELLEPPSNGVLTQPHSHQDGCFQTRKRRRKSQPTPPRDPERMSTPSNPSPRPKMQLNVPSTPNYTASSPPHNSPSLTQQVNAPKDRRLVRAMKRAKRRERKRQREERRERRWEKHADPNRASPAAHSESPGQHSIQTGDAPIQSPELKFEISEITPVDEIECGFPAQRGAKTPSPTTNDLRLTKRYDSPKVEPPSSPIRDFNASESHRGVEERGLGGEHSNQAHLDEDKLHLGQDENQPREGGIPNRHIAPSNPDEELPRPKSESPDRDEEPPAPDSEFPDSEFPSLGEEPLSPGEEPPISGEDQLAQADEEISFRAEASPELGEPGWSFPSFDESRTHAILSSTQAPDGFKDSRTTIRPRAQHFTNEEIQRIGHGSQHGDKFTPEEDQLILFLREVKGVQWSEFPHYFPNRTQKSVHSHYIKKVKRLVGQNPPSGYNDIINPEPCEEDAKVPELDSNPPNPIPFTNTFGTRFSQGSSFSPLFRASSSTINYPQEYNDRVIPESPPPSDEEVRIGFTSEPTDDGHFHEATPNEQPEPPIKDEEAPEYTIDWIGTPPKPIINELSANGDSAGRQSSIYPPVLPSGVAIHEGIEVIPETQVYEELDIGLSQNRIDLQTEVVDRLETASPGKALKSGQVQDQVPTHCNSGLGEKTSFQHKSSSTERQMPLGRKMNESPPQAVQHDKLSSTAAGDNPHNHAHGSSSQSVSGGTKAPLADTSGKDSSPDDGNSISPASIYYRSVAHQEDVYQSPDIVLEDGTSQRVTRSQKMTGKTSQHFFVPASSRKSRTPAGTGSCLPFPPLHNPNFGLIQEEVANNPFHLIIATIFLTKTKGAVAIPVFRELIITYPTPEDLAHANLRELTEMIRPLGLQNRRANHLIELAKDWISCPPTHGRRFRSLNYPYQGAGRDVFRGDILDDEDEREGAWEIAHLPGLGPYAFDSWRIFCRDLLRGKAGGYNGEGAPAEFEPEWTRVLPKDKELRAFLRWMWLREGWVWDPLTGDKEPADPYLLQQAADGALSWDINGDLQPMADIEISEALSGGQASNRLQAQLEIQKMDTQNSISQNIEAPAYVTPGTLSNPLPGVSAYQPKSQSPLSRSQDVGAGLIEETPQGSERPAETPPPPESQPIVRSKFEPRARTPGSGMKLNSQIAKTPLRRVTPSLLKVKGLRGRLPGF